MHVNTILKQSVVKINYNPVAVKQMMQMMVINKYNSLTIYKIVTHERALVRFCIFLRISLDIGRRLGEGRE